MNEIDETLEEAKGLSPTPQFEGEIFFSTDGKHTVHVKADTAEGRKAGGTWALNTYRWIVGELGTKAEMWDKAINGKKEEKKPFSGTTGAQGGQKNDCPHDEGYEVKISNSEKNKGKAYKKCLKCGAFMGWATVS